MDSEKVEKLAQNNENEGGMVEVASKPVDDWKNDPKSKSKFTINLILSLKVERPTRSKGPQNKVSHTSVVTTKDGTKL